MLVTLQDDGVVRLYDSVEDAIRQVEALDAEAVFRAIFDDTGEVYVIHWIRPNIRGRFLVGNGEYTLVRKNEKDVPALLRLLRDAKTVEPPESATVLREIQRRLTNRAKGQSPA
jgi:hypothetical protein